MQELADIYSEETEKTHREIINSIDESIRYYRQDPMEKVIAKLGELGIPTKHEDLEYLEQRIYTDQSAATDYFVEDPNFVKNHNNKGHQQY